jgi:hypothetical protein
MCFAAAFVLTPIGVRSQVAALPSVAEPAAKTIVFPPILAIAPHRDAFVPQVPVDDDASAAVAQRASTLPAPPRDLRARLPVALESPPHLTAIATGAQPSAIIEIGGVAHILTVGDPLANARIRAIGNDAVELDNGRRLRLAGDSASP